MAMVATTFNIVLMPEASGIYTIDQPQHHSRNDERDNQIHQGHVFACICMYLHTSPGRMRKPQPNPRGTWRVNSPRIYLPLHSYG
jgi:hypothetical protein